jgi:HAMP domain-containing protein
MMTDIVERLRKPPNAPLLDEAADEIERLTKEIELLKISRREIIEIDEERVAEIERLRDEITRFRAALCIDRCKEHDRHR